MQANPILKVAAGAVLLLVILVVVTRCGGPETGATAGPEQVLPRAGGEVISDETLEAMAIEGDTEEDTVATLVATVRDAKRQMESLRLENEGLRATNNELQGMRQQMETQLRGELRSLYTDLETRTQRENADRESQLQDVLDQVKARMDGLSDGSIPTTRGTGFGSNGDTVWIGPDDSIGSEPSGFSPPVATGFRSLTQSALADELTGPSGPSQGRLPVVPAFTIAKNSTLINATAMTALIGRVPVGNDITDPYSFKVIVGRDNLIANGKEVPELAYAVMSGTAIGDWTLGCVSGDVFSITFVFHDGTIRTVPEPPDISKGTAQVRNVKIGELADAYGNPCVNGRKITNAPKYLAGRVGTIAAGAAAQAAAAAETTQTINGVGGFAGGVTVVDGDQADFVLGNTLAGAAQEAATWLAERQALSFDAIYRAPGAEVAIHITEEIRIDYDPEGRKTHHEGYLSRSRYRELD